MHFPYLNNLFFNAFMQVQSQIQSLVHTTFSCIAYLRDLLDDSCFEDHKLGKSVIKKLVKNSKSKEILNLLEGMYESIKLEYLESFEIGIYLDLYKGEDKGKGKEGKYDNKEEGKEQENNNTNTNTNINLSESYTFQINYNQNDTNPESTIKSFCLYLQKLKPLPPSKYVTLKLYYNEKVPLNYNPKGFKDGTTHNFIYKNKKIKIKEEGKGNGVIPKEIYVDEGRGGKESGGENGRDKEDKQPYFSQPKPSQPSQPKHSQPSQPKHSQPINTNPSQVIPSQPTHTNPSQPINTQPSQPNPTPNPNPTPIHTPNPTHTPTPSLNTPLKNIDLINCLCGDSSDTFDMIQCDYCNYWLHTVCCGFYSNTDKRIPKGKYQCFKCLNNDYINNINIYFRKSLSILYNEGFKSYTFFNKRMNIPKEDLKNLILKLEEEGFLKKYGKTVYVVKNEIIKKKIKEYFKIKRSSIPKRDVKMGYSKEMM